MAILTKMVVATTLLTSFTLAAPARPVHTVTETDWTTIDVTTTIYIDDAISRTFTHATTTPSSAAIETTLPETPTAAVSTEAPTEAPAVPSSTSTSVTPTAVPASFYTPDVAATTPVTTMTTSTSVAPAASPSLQKAATGPSGASDSATCEGESAACQGDITYYTPGLGACGVSNTESDFIIALAAGFMGSQSNGNPYCGRTLTIYNPANGNTAQATVQDKCPGCAGRSIDLTPSLFEAVGGDLGLGRVSGVDWWFND